MAINDPFLILFTLYCLFMVKIEKSWQFISWSVWVCKCVWVRVCVSLKEERERYVTVAVPSCYFDLPGVGLGLQMVDGSRETLQQCVSLPPSPLHSLSLTLFSSLSLSLSLSLDYHRLPLLCKLDDSLYYPVTELFMCLVYVERAGETTRE